MVSPGVVQDHHEEALRHGQEGPPQEHERQGPRGIAGHAEQQVQQESLRVAVAVDAEGRDAEDPMGPENVDYARDDREAVAETKGEIER